MQQTVTEYTLTDAEREVIRQIVAPLDTVNAQMAAAVTLLRAQHGMSPNAHLSADFCRLAEPSAPEPAKE